MSPLMSNQMRWLPKIKIMTTPEEAKVAPKVASKLKSHFYLWTHFTFFLACLETQRKKKWYINYGYLPNGASEHAIVGCIEASALVC